MRIKWMHRAVDLAMTAALLLMMSYSLVGERAHEWIGMGMFTLVIVHNILNRFWWRSQTRNLRVKTPYGMMQKIVICLLVLCMLGSMMSGIYISRYVFRSVFSSGRNTVFADRIHLFCAYWGFTLMGVHLGMHARTILGIRKMKSGSERMRTVVFAIAAVYGAVASARRRFWAYFFLQNHFFAEFEVPLHTYLIDYLFILLMFGFIGFLISEWMIGITKRKRHV